MADDDKHGDSHDEGFDPWEDVEPVDVPDLDALGGGEPLPGDPADDLVSDWLADDAAASDTNIDHADGEVTDTTLGVFVPESEEDRATGEAFPEVLVPDAPDEEVAAEDLDVFAGAVEASEDSPTEATAPATVVTATPTPEKPRAKKSGLGQAAGVALGGLMAVPVTLGILMWGLRQDPLNIVKHVPDSMAFLVPAELRGRGGQGAAPAVDQPAVAKVDEGAVVTSGDEPAATDIATAADATVPEEPVETVAPEIVDTDIVATDPPATEVVPVPAEPTDPAVASAAPADLPAEPVAATETVASAEPAVAPAVEEPITTAEPEPSPPAPETAISGGEAVVAAEPPATTLAVVEPVTPPEWSTDAMVREPDPLDFTRIDEATVAAQAAFDALEVFDGDAANVADPALRDRERTLLVVDWYRRLAAVAEESAGLERLAAESGRPLDDLPEAVRGLQQRIVAEPGWGDRLARLARNWFSYPSRESSGIMLPARFVGTRQVGPYWCSTVTMADAGNRTRDLTIVSRAAPAATAGEDVLVTGLIVDGDVVWASDVRPAAAAVRAP